MAFLLIWIPGLAPIPPSLASGAPAAPGRAAAVLGLLLLIPIVVALWFRRRASSVSEESIPTLLFAYRRFTMWISLGGILIWWTAIDLLHADALVETWIGAPAQNDIGLRPILPWFLLWIPPVVVFYLCVALGSPMHSLRGVTRTRTEAIGQSFWAAARFVLPTGLLVLGILDILAAPRWGVLLIVAGIVAGRLTSRKVATAYGMEQHALTTGELRDRAFALARKAGARLNQIYVLPTERMRLANAFARSGNNLLLTDYLLKNLNKAEVDAILAHEMTHLGRKHIRKRLLFWFGAVALAAMASVLFERWRLPSIPQGPVIYACLLLLFFVVSRRSEFTADAGSLQLAGDPEAMITGLVRVSRLNTMPLDWSLLDEQMLTHPSTRRRIARLARAAGIPEARIPELVARAAAPPTDVYTLPTSTMASGKVFSTQWKSRSATSSAWMMIATMAIVPAGVARVIQELHPPGVERLAAYAGGILLAVCCCLILSNFMPMRGMPALEPELRNKLESESVPVEPRGGLFVGLAPDAGPRAYEGNWSWDVGLLTGGPDRLVYRGEETRFALPRERITGLALGSGPVSWFRPPAVYVNWKDDDGTERTFNLRPLGARSMLDMARQTRSLAVELESWRRGIAPAGRLLPSFASSETGELDRLGPPVFGQVTSKSPRVVVGKRNLVATFVLDTLAALAAATLLGLRFASFDAMVLSSDATPWLSATEAYLYVLVAVWIVRLFLLWPFWRFRESSSPAIPAPAEPAPRPL